MKSLQIIGITPLEMPDAGLALCLSTSGFFPVLHLGREEDEAVAALKELAERMQVPFGVCFVSPFTKAIDLPVQVGVVIAPYGMKLTLPSRARLFYQVYTAEQAFRAKEEGADGLIIKGNEGAGWVSDESSFILFQRIVGKIADIEIWVQGGIGIHSAAAMAALGADGIVLDSQLIPFSECSASVEIKNLCLSLNGSETKVIDNRRVLSRSNFPVLSLGQDVALGGALASRYKKLHRLAFAIREAVYGHLKQAKALPPIHPGNALAKELNVHYPIAQGPMTRVSDVPAFAEAVAEAGALPFIALSLLRGEKAQQVMQETRRLAGGKTWGVGILGFISQELRDEQLTYILEEKPPVVLIAGGRPSQAKALEEQGIKVFLHVPSVALLDMFIRDGARRFVFEGRECGGHVGPLSSLVLWERQIDRLLQEESAEPFSVLFAGGIHDAFSAAFVGLMAAPLATKGARIGVLMGTAYLYTEEVVSTGAIVRQFQEQAIVQSETVLLETAPGHETRCLLSPFTAYFNEEKEQLLRAGMEKTSIWAELEKLNVGRLRIAAKGIERRGDELVSMAEREQLSAGMYMIGQVAALKDEVISLLELHRRVGEDSIGYIREAVLGTSPGEGSRSLNVAIVGMACIYPGARNIDEFWRNIVLGKDAVTEVPDERWNKEIYYDPSATGGDKSASKWGGFLPVVDFDPVEFGIPPQSLAAIGPAQLLSLLVAREALKNAGYADREFDRENVSVIMAADGGNDLENLYRFRGLFPQLLGEMPKQLDMALPRLTEDSFPGVLANVIAGRICNRLDLGGRNYSVDAACASSLAAVDLACQELQLGKADMVLAGAADLHNSINDYLLFSSTRALSRTGKCMTFDSAADGIALGEGVAMLVLKRYEDAKRDGDTVYAIIKGVGGSSDGKSLGLTAPRKKGQWRALERAYEQAGLSPAEAGLIEAHGTGTVVGDQTELSALSDLFIQSGATAGQTSLGSVKTQIGHTKCAAGLAGLIKAALSVYHGIKPPTLHIKAPNRYYAPRLSPFRFNAEAGPWLEPSRIAGVSAFGFGGTNFHVVIANESRMGMADKKAPPVIQSWPAELFVFRGDDYEEARGVLAICRRILLNNDKISFKDLAYSLAVHNGKAVQLSIVADTVEDLLLKMDLALSGAVSDGIFVREEKEGKVAFLFPGQGSQRVNMARSLLTIFPAMRELLGSNPAYGRVLYPHSVFDEGSLRQQKDEIRDTRFAQPLLGIVDLAIAGFLRELGIEPAMVAGHSYGELPALCFAGVFDPQDLVPLSESRARAILDATGDDKGIMIALNSEPGMLMQLTGEGSGIHAVNHNSPEQWVLAGATADMQALMEKLKAQEIWFSQLEVACAFHSPLVAGARMVFEEAMKDVVFGLSSIAVWSNTTASVYPRDPAGIRARLAEHLVKPVRFSEEIAAMYDSGARIFIEVGPGKVLSSLTKSILGKDELILHTEDRKGLAHLLMVLGRYIGTGREIALEKLFAGRNARLLDLSNPDDFKRRATTWFVNGQAALPSVGKLPAHGAVPIVDPLRVMSTGAAGSPEGAGDRGAADRVKGAADRVNGVPERMNGAAERIMEEYLNSVKYLIRAQRDVVLGYFGYAPARDGFPEAPDAMISIGGEKGLDGDAVSLRAHVEDVPEERKPEPVKTPGFGKADLQEMVLKVVSNKTGYPPEMLGLDLDMEAELSIDSIKRMEIVGELKNRWREYGAGEIETEKMIARMASVKTLRGLLDWLAGEVEGRVRADISGGQDEGKVGTLVRRRFELTPSGVKRQEADRLRGKHFAVTNDSGRVANAIKEELEAMGALATIITAADVLDHFDGLILLDLLDSPQRWDIMETFSLIKKLDAARAKWVYVVSDFNSHLDKNPEPGLMRHFQGYPGFLKSLNQEWEHASCRTVHLNGELSPEVIGSMVVDELLYTDSSAEILYQGGLRQTVELVPSDLRMGADPDLRLDASSTVLVLGGAQGITAELMIRFSKEYPCRYILVGRSPDPRKEKTDVFALQGDKEAIRQALIGEGQLRSAAAIEKRAEEIDKRNQILRTITSLERNGATVDYYSLDLRNEGQLRVFISHLYEEHGRIDGVVHGAGLLEDKLFQHKTAESFERVFSTKVTPLRVLEEQLRPDTQFVALFSSIASVFGNRGQTDYAAANSVMDRYARELNRKINGKVIAINWGPWKGTGMVSPSLEREYERRGIPLIPLPAGRETFLNELKYGNESQILIMAEYV